MPEPVPPRGLDFRRTRLIKGHGLVVPLPLAERLRAARRIPQAVVKITSFAHGAKKVRELMRYISRDGELALESESGETLTNLDQQREVVAEWADNFDPRPRSRDAAHIVFSMPRGSDPEALRKAVRTVMTRHFSGHQAVWGIHVDRQHPHAHVILVMRGRGQAQDKKLEFKKQDLYRLREVFAEAAREQGVPLAASPRAARGVGRKGMSQAIRQMREKKIFPKVWQEAVRECMERDIASERPWEKAMEERNVKERAFYMEDAEGLRAQAKAQANENQRKALLQAAMDLERFSKSMPEPKTRRQMWLEELEPSKNKKQSQPSKSQKESGWER